METGNTYDEKPIIGTNMSVELCLVCGDRASGRHYGAISCEGCKGFFKRSIRKQLGYQCRGTMNCEVTKHHRNRCQFCRLQKCLASGMRSDSVQHERKPMLDKKDIQTSSNSLGTNCSGASNPNPNQSMYHHRNKVYNTASHQPSILSTTVAATAESFAAATASNLNIFPVGFNFADLTQTLSKRALLTTKSFQQQQQQQQQDTTYKYSPGIQINDDDSMDNSTTGILTSQNIGMGSANSNASGCGGNGNNGGGSGDISGSNCSDTPVPGNTTSLSSITTAAANIIQSSFEKNLLTQSLDLIATVQQQYERSANNSTGNSNTNSNANVNNCSSGAISTSTITNAFNNQNSSNSSSNCNIVKEEITIDDHPMLINRDLINEMNITCSSNDDDQILQHQQQQQIFELPILPEVNVNFNLQCPSMVPSYLNVHYVCESGSRLLFLSVYWIKKIPAFQQLSEDIQIKLLRYHWVELFTIGLSQCSRNLSISTIMTTLATNIIQLSEIDKINPIKIRKMSEHTYQLNEFVQSMQLLNLDDYEYAYIRLLIIFNIDGIYIKDHMKRSYIEKLQEYALNHLKIYYAEKFQHNHSNNNNICNSSSNILTDQKSERCIKILLRLMQLRSLESEIIEELFFFNLIGQVQIETMIPYILKLGGGGV